MKHFFYLWLCAAIVQCLNGQMVSSITNGVYNPASCALTPAPSWCSGSDIGAWVNAAISQLGCGRVQIPAGTYTWTTPIVEPRCVLVEGASGNGTILNWAGSSSGAAWAVGDQATGLSSAYTQGGIMDLTLQTTESTPPIGLYIGGDPAGVITPTADSGDHTTFQRLRVTGFSVGVEWGDNAFSNTFIASSITNNSTGIYFPHNASTNAGESIIFIASAIQNSTGTGIKLYGGYSDFYFYGSHCDYNNLCLDVEYGSQAVFQGHIEQFLGPVASLSNGNQSMGLVLNHPQITLTNSAGTDAEEINVSGTYANLIWDGGDLYVSHNVTNVINWGAAQAQPNSLKIDSPWLTVSGSFGNLVNISPNWQGFTRIDQAYGVDTYTATIANLTGHGGQFTSLGTGGLRFTPSDDSNTAVLYGTNAANSVTRWAVDATGDFSTANLVPSGHINQSATKNLAGTCAMSSGTNCTFTLNAAFTSMPVCIAYVQGTVPIAGACSVSGTMVTITAASSNSQTWGAILIGNPN